MPYFALLDDALTGCAVLYRRHIRSDFISPNATDTLDGILRQGWQQGLHSVLFVGYEFGLPLNALPPSDKPERNETLAVHWFADKANIGRTEEWLAAQTVHADGLCGISRPQPSVGKTQYLQDISAIREAIGRGETYQINYTLRLHMQAYGNPVALYRKLRQPVPYGVLAHLPAQPSGDASAVSPDDGNLVADGIWTLCFSPELFLNIGTDGIIRTEPMKGTAPFLGDGLDDRRAEQLRADPKNRAENVMIVDLLRNDLGKISRTGGVAVPEPFKVSRFGSVWQMTSEITARAADGITAADIFRAAFPCGSITGAPKRMSMSIIENLEYEGRGLYTGSIGFLEPCSGGLGFSGTLNVVIRTLELRKRENGLFDGVYGVGSGIVIDSNAEAEYEECAWKARFLNNLMPDFGIFETMRCEQGRIALLARHESRLQTAAGTLNLPEPHDFASRAADYAAALPQGIFRIKAELAADGIKLSHAPLNGLPQAFAVISDTLAEPDYLSRFKTTRRSTLDAVWQNAEKQGAFDGLIFDADGFLLEGGRSNVFVRTGSQWHTPPADGRILNGIMRQEILRRPQDYLGTQAVQESRISLETLLSADEIRLSNALRGVFAVRLLPPRCCI
ncbi:MAG: bifunctional anthranilate synthase component I family protein/class IV aminotransferase [Neisseria sp.]|nr:bifunctional anthranilate synthase component I family protein/class IV aminotransferase [Neisseria sp.]